MRIFLAFTLLAGTVAVIGAAKADAQEWNGFYAGGRIGMINAESGGTERIEFDKNLDGSFGDVVLTSAGADAFSPGFCNGAANDRTPAAGCDKDDEGADYALVAGFDRHVGPVVLGLVGEIGRSKARDSVAAFSTTPAFYTMTRRLRTNGAIRARAGLPLGGTLPYVTAGLAIADMERSFATSNTVNTFTQRGADKTVYGTRIGAGIDQKIGGFTIGALYLYSTYKDGDYRVRAQGPAPSTNPFILTNANGTDFRRSDSRFDTHSLSAVVSVRF
jgi:outer membrane immunogenic protein